MSNLPDCGHTYKMMVLAALDDACPLCMQIKLNQATARIEALEAALREIANWPPSTEYARDLARAALAPEQDKNYWAGTGRAGNGGDI
jgi:hypothetical protein